ncbi:DUF2147 domain-containing protein [Legionella taurinensis]|uniref:DUF2147 domain-containing protein n=2 Tax=Legionella taurinensis TaxID=70611 RepID=A0A3A5L4V9_9GAMM|nr:DUF2147 domain-containing protein [Legionella taurinensis]MDX1838031.1 DUF2147 domain-containing protein [Legionella taurinensis]PUT39384.1 DUF2147 domain-containing protein [Legionella taurinensis]PUT41693.1 DUF2147 domain-containing protein [Legionella taurinensis]PUT44527.1 DUF2147 domain-containing protein [Legionella taurinensis]PUT46771.1 DUF2147 domain-containing protein [Legionella taurinensis]
MEQLKSLFAVLVMMLFVPAVMAASPAGTWTTIDDVTGKKRAVVRINVSGNTLSGTIVKVYPQAGDTGICSKCPGGFKGKPIQGLRFVWGLKDKGNGEWDGGQILDPKTGKVYRAKMSLKGNKLYVRGYVGVSALGRTQVWVR